MRSQFGKYFANALRRDCVNENWTSISDTAYASAGGDGGQNLLLIGGEDICHSASGFVSRIVARGHESVIEHSNVVFSLEDATADLLFLVLRSNRFLTCVPAGNTYYLAGNIRMFKDLVRTLRNQMNQADESGAELLRKLVEQFYNLPQAFFTDFVEVGWMKAEGFAEKEAAEPIVPKVIYQEPSGQVVELLHLDSPNVLPEWLSLADRELLTTCTVRITTSRDSSLQEVRHRPAAYSQESQRYVDLQNRLEYIHPAEIPQDVAFPVDLSGIPALSSSFLRGTGEGETVSLSFADMIYFTKACYTALRQAGFSPEVARGDLAKCHEDNDCCDKIPSAVASLSGVARRSGSPAANSRASPRHFGVSAEERLAAGSHAIRNGLVTLPCGCKVIWSSH